MSEVPKAPKNDATSSAAAVPAKEQREREAEAGLCALCCQSRVQQSAKGQRFWRCLAADAEGDPGGSALLRYPPLPVLGCHAFLRREDGDTAR